MHPGKMGVFVAAALKEGGHTVYWASEGRSAATRERAGEFDLDDAVTLARLCQSCEVIVSVCPPHAAEEVARQVLNHAFHGLYVDANAIAPERAARIAAMMARAGAPFVDGGIVGGPAWRSGETWLHLSGERAGEVAALFPEGPLKTNNLGSEIGRASALKACYAAYTKGTTALLCAILATAEQLDVRQPLAQQWERSWPGLAEEAENRARRVTAKAWRFEGEMAEIAATFRAAGLPGDFHEGAGRIYERLAHYKDEPEMPSLTDVLRSLLGE